MAAGEVIPIFLDESIFAGISKDISAIHFKWDPSDPEWQRNAQEKIVMRLIDRI